MDTRLQRLVLVRHGETVGESSIRYHGITDVPLSDLGRRQLVHVRDVLRSEQFGVVYTSTLRRTIETARIVAAAVPACAVAGFDEINFGAWEGLTQDEIAARDPGAYARWRASTQEFTYPRGDAVAAFRARVVSAWRGLLPTVPAHVLIVGHKGVISSIIGDMLQLAPAARAAWRIDLASVHVLVAGERAWRAAVVNDHPQSEEA